MDERSLLTLLQKRPNEGMKELMRQYMGYCYYIVRNKLSEFPQEDIEECVSDVFVDAYRYRENIDLEILLWLSDKNDCVCVRVKGEHSGPEGAAWLGKAEKSIGRRGIL